RVLNYSAIAPLWLLTAFTVALPAGFDHTVDALACILPVNEDPVVCKPASATADPTLTIGVVPVLVVVTASKDHLAIGSMILMAGLVPWVKVPEFALRV